MMRRLALVFFLLLMSATFVLGHGEETFATAEGLIAAKIPCSDLEDDQLEIIGDFYMEQMHPGEAHIVMDERMGGEGSVDLRAAHIAMARSLYCGEHDAMSSGMMRMMMDSGGMNMMGGSMGFGSWWLWSIVGMLFWIALLVALVLLIVWLYKTITAKAANNGSATEILKKRFAKGEITKKQYESMKKEIR